MSDREKVITTLQYRINEARNKHLKVTTIFIKTLSDCMALLKEQKAQKFFVDENGKIIPLPVVFPNCPLKEQEAKPTPTAGTNEIPLKW